MGTPFRNSILAGLKLVRDAIQSTNFITGVSGWSINKDGTAEFLNVVIRGILNVIDPDGSYVKIYDQMPGSGAIIEFHLPTAVGINQTPGFVQTGVDPVFGTKGMSLVGPTYGAVPPAASIISFLPGFLTIDSTAMDMITRGDWEVAFEGPPGTFVIKFQVQYPSGDVFCAGVNAYGNSFISGDGGINTRQITASNEGINVVAGVGTVAAAGFVNMPATSSFVVRKQYTATRIRVRMCADAFSTAANTVAQYGANINAVDTIVTELTMNTMNVHSQGFGEAYIGAGLAAGNYTIQGRWQRTAGAGTVTSGGRLIMMAEEVA
jgi:hypothetical protein